ncbi:MAG: hypothetical protein ACFE96_07165 [Candidatus Hermodarchaeota archaeon]
MILTNFFDDLPQLTKEQISDYQDSFEWWYFDVEDTNGNSLVIILKRKDSFTHKINPSVYVEYKINGEKGNLVMIYPKEEFKVVDSQNNDGKSIYFGENYIKIFKTIDDTIKHYQVYIDFHKFKINMNFTPRHKGFKPSKNGVYFTHKKKSDLIKCVNFAAPRIIGEGKIEFFGDILEISGEGYHDHPWGTSNLLQTNSMWHWGRFFNESISIMYAEVHPHKDFSGELKFFYFSHIDDAIPVIENVYDIDGEEWKKEQGANLKFPHNLTITCPKLGIELKTEYIELLLNIKIYNRSRVNFELIEKTTNKKNGGIGWTEYWNVPSWMRGLLIKMNRSEQANHVKNTLKIIND